MLSRMNSTPIKVSQLQFDFGAVLKDNSEADNIS